MFSRYEFFGGGGMPDCIGMVEGLFAFAGGWAAAEAVSGLSLIVYFPAMSM